MEEYQQLVKNILEKGNYKKNRTDSDTISKFSESYTVNLQDGFPLLTTKDLSGFRWNSLIHELLWYFSGEHHINNLTEETSIWDAWADDEGRLPTAYGRFWRRYPIPEEKDQLSGEWWPLGDEEWIEKAKNQYDVTEEEIRDGIDRWINVEEDGRKTFDQIQYILDTLNNEHPYRGPESRRMIVNAWHPANAAVSKLPPCHFTFVFNVQNDKLNLHLTQRSGDVALGIPFNIASYSLIAKIISKQTPFKPGKFSHTIVDAHAYCGKHERGEWYQENLDKLQRKIKEVEEPSEFKEIKKWVEDNAPEERDGEERYDHVPGLLEQLSRKPREKPEMNIKDKDIEDLEYQDFELKDYNPYPGIKFKVAE
ncbi:MAG: thymidylate synthase [Candidatus Nanohaloarchaea archaeon]